MNRSVFSALYLAIVLIAFCGTNGAAMDSSDMAASYAGNFLVPEYTPPAATGIFADVPVDYWAAGWIEQLYLDGITNGCSTNPLSYCPGTYVTRAEMAAYLLRLKYGGNGSMGGTSNKLVCVTGEIRFPDPGPPTPPDEFPPYCVAQPETATFTKTISGGLTPSFNDVFEIICTTDGFYTYKGTVYEVGDDPVFWGLRCREDNGWENTGCSSSSYDNVPVDLPQGFNGCFSDDEEYHTANIFATCCKIIDGE